MTSSRPDRAGWMTGKCASLPSCPPIAAFTAFETRALDCLASLFESCEGEFRRQLAFARVIDRIKTAVGFRTRVSVDRSACRPLTMRLRGGHFDVEGLELGMGVILWDEGGYLDTIEGFTYEDVPLEGRELADLRFVRVVQLVCSRRGASSPRRGLCAPIAQ